MAALLTGFVRLRVNLAAYYSANKIKHLFFLAFL
jgi:hypothetical protein